MLVFFLSFSMFLQCGTGFIRTGQWAVKWTAIIKGVNIRSDVRQPDGEGPLSIHTKYRQTWWMTLSLLLQPFYSDVPQQDVTKSSKHTHTTPLTWIWSHITIIKSDLRYNEKYNYSSIFISMGMLASMFCCYGNQTLLINRGMCCPPRGSSWLPQPPYQSILLPNQLHHKPNI